ncbi:MAG: response regulator [Candidatus Melainabacteria bacterium]|nr:response regulator [Candidatus Melainabacteria bacterium]
MDFLFDSSFMPHGYCLRWTPGLVTLFVVGNLIVAISYFSIPVALLVFIRKRRDIAFSSMFKLFALFIFSCGLTHLFKIWTIWHGTYWLEAGLDTFTGVVSFITAVLLWKLLPEALKIPRPSELAQANEKVANLAKMVESSGDGIIGIDPRGTILSWNRGAVSLYGFEPEEAIGRPIEIILPGASDDADLVKQICQGEAVSYCDTVHRRSDGSLVDVSVTASSVRSDSGETVGASLIARDVSDRRLAERNLTIARDQAVQALNFKSEFLANMSHEIRTPLNAVIGLSDLLARTRLNAEQRDLTKTIVTSANVLLDLINNVLDYSKLEARRLELELMDFELVHVVEETAEVVATKSRDKGLALMTYVDPGVPNLLRGDPGRIRQILINLIDNAIKFTEEGEVVVRATCLSQSGREALIEIRVSDTGIGISSETASQLFTPFTQAGSETSRTYGGTGLGLSISRKLAALMNGNLSLESDPGGGTTFKLLIPLEMPGADLPKQEPERGAFDYLRALIIDGPRGSSAIVRDYLNSWGMTCDLVVSFEAALEALDSQSYDFVFVDHELSQEDWSAVKAIEKKSEARLLLITSQTRGLIAEAAIEAGYAACLVRPLKQSQLFDCIMTLVESKSDETDSISLSEERTRAGQDISSTSLILVVEDNPVNQKVALLQLRDLGLAAHAVGNGKEALAATESTNYSLILMDCQMPVMDGYETTRAIRKREAHTGNRCAIVAMTAHALEGDREKCLAAGMDDYISKPVNQAKIRAVVEKWLARDEACRAGKKPTGGEFPQLSTIELSQLEKTFGKEAREEVLTSFTEHTGDYIEQLVLAVEECDRRRVTALLHDIKGMCSSVFATEMAKQSYKLEVMSRGDDFDWDKIENGTNLLKDLYQAVLDELERCGLVSPEKDI